MVSIKSLNRASVLDGDAIAAQAAMARTNMDLFIASPPELAQSRRVLIGGLATLAGMLASLACAPGGGLPLSGGPRRPQKLRASTSSRRSETK